MPAAADHSGSAEAQGRGDAPAWGSDGETEMNRRGFFAALLVAPFAVIVSQATGTHIPGRKFQAGTISTQEAFLMVLEAEERVAQITGTTDWEKAMKMTLVRNSFYDPT